MQFFSIIAVFGLAAFAAAAPQESDPAMSSMASTATAASSTVADMTTSTAPVSPTTSCIRDCGTDLCCQAACVGVPCPNEADANRTTECAMQCPQGNGTAADTQAYADCQSSCISSLFFSSTGVPAATGTNGAAATNSASATGDSSDSSNSASASSARASGSSAASSSASTASESATGAANSLQIGASTAGILGLLMAAIAL